MNQPYQAPNADVAVTGSQEAYQPKFLSLSGRIGRMRYFVYAGIVSIIYYAIAFGILAATSGGIEGKPQGIGESLLYLVSFGSFLVGMIYVTRRLNDINITGWFSLLLLLPLLNLIFILFLVFKKGSAGANKFGLPPSANDALLKVIFTLMLMGFAISFLGVFAAIAIPAYMN